MYRQFNIQQFYVLPTQCIYVFWVDLRKTAIISLYNINWLVCITEPECVYCAVRAKSLNFHPSYVGSLTKSWRNISWKTKQLFAYFKYVTFSLRDSVVYTAFSLTDSAVYTAYSFTAVLCIQPTVWQTVLCIQPTVWQTLLCIQPTVWQTVLCIQPTVWQTVMCIQPTISIHPAPISASYIAHKP